MYNWLILKSMKNMTRSLESIHNIILLLYIDNEFHRHEGQLLSKINKEYLVSSVSLHNYLFQKLIIETY